MENKSKAFLQRSTTSFGTSGHTGCFGGKEGVVIPYQSLSPEALQGLIEEFVTRDGTDTGDTETELADRVRQVMAQLKRGTTRIVFDAGSQTANIVSCEDGRRC